MFCPLCRAEYREGFIRCSDCDVELVTFIQEEHVEDNPVECAWRGTDPVAFSRVVDALREASVPHHVKATSDHLFFEFGTPRPFYEVQVLRSDLLAAQRLLEGISESPPLARHERLETPSEELEDRVGPMISVRRERNSSEASVEVWSGDDTEIARALCDCLRENEIGCRTRGDPSSRESILVWPDDEARAREIIRQVVEGTPPA